MNILVTGAGGFIGFHLSNYLAKRGHNVTGIDIHFPEKNVEMPFIFEAVKGDFRNKELLEKSLKDKDFVFHLASAHLQISLKESEYWDINVHSLKHFLETAQNSGVKRFVHVSSVGVYGNLKKWPANEKSECIPQSLYGETKLAGEKVVEEFWRSTNFPVVIIRPAWVFGPGCPRTSKLYKTIKKKRFVMIGDGENLRHPVYIKDMMDAFDLSIKRKEAVGKIFIIGGENAITTNELVNAFSKVFDLPGPLVKIPYGVGKAIAYISENLFSLINKEPPISTRTLEFFDTNNSFDISRAKTILGFQPEFSFENGLKDCRIWLEKYAL
jgi:nucleoside-diphosphate-sugar epimerase